MPSPAHPVRTSRRHGAGVVELALILPLLLVAMLCLVQLGAFLGQRQRVVQATYEAARYAAAGDSRPTQVQVQAYAHQVLEGLGVRAEGMTVSLSHTTDAGDPIVTVGLNVPVRLLAGALTLPALQHQQQFSLVEREDRS